MAKFEEYLEAVRSVVEDEMIGEGKENSKVMALINKMKKDGPMKYRDIQKFLYGSEDASRGSNTSNITKLANAGTIRKRSDGLWELTDVGMKTSKPYSGDGKGDNWYPSMFRGREDYKKKSMKGESFEISEAAKFSWDDGNLYYSTVKNIDGKIAQAGSSAAAKALAEKSFMKVDKALLQKLGKTKKQIQDQIGDDASGEYVAKGYFFASGADIRSFIEEADN